MKWIGRAWFEIELLIPPPHVMVFCVYDQGANTRNLGSLRRAQQGALEESSADAGALLGAIHRWSGEYSR